MKVRTNVLIEREVLEKTRELGLNVSKACENALKNLHQRLKKR